MSSPFQSAARNGTPAFLTVDAGLLEPAVSRLAVDSLPEQVALWTLWLDRLSPAGSGWFEWLSPDERERAKRFRFERDRAHFTLGRGFLRSLLGQSLGVDPASLEFAYGPAGKPSLAGRCAGEIQFNLAHSGGLMICAISEDIELGVDLERVRDIPEASSILRRHFPAGLADQWHRLPPGLQSMVFFESWVRREAALKWSGCGLTGLEESAGTVPNPASLICFTPASGYVAALAFGEVGGV